MKKIENGLKMNNKLLDKMIKINIIEYLDI